MRPVTGGLPTIHSATLHLSQARSQGCAKPMQAMPSNNDCATNPTQTQANVLSRGAAFAQPAALNEVEIRLPPKRDVFPCFVLRNNCGNDVPVSNSGCCCIVPLFVIIQECATHIIVCRPKLELHDVRLDGGRVEAITHSYDTASDKTATARCDDYR